MQPFRRIVCGNSALTGLALLAAMMATPLARATTYTVLHTFMGGTTDGANPDAGVIRDSAGNFYGTTQYGGASGAGVVYKLDTTGKLNLLYSFTGGTDGGYPYAGVIRDSAGNLYGTTLFGGASGLGVVYKLDTTGKETVLHSFMGGTTDGAYPYAGVIRGSAGNFYGTTEDGGASGFGVVYKLDTSDTLTVLHSFIGGTTDGAVPFSGVIRDSTGNLYGTTYSGGASSSGGATGAGVVYRLDTSGTLSLLHSFTGGTAGTIDGANPYAGVIRDSAGNFYGTTSAGGTGTYPGYGVVFKLNPQGNETVLYSFTGGADGGYPHAGVIRDSKGNLYGTTYSGLIAGGVYKLDTSNKLTVPYGFTPGSANGADPIAGVIRDSAGNLYGTTYLGGLTTGVCAPIGCGVVYKLKP